MVRDPSQRAESVPSQTVVEIGELLGHRVERERRHHRSASLTPPFGRMRIAERAKNALGERVGVIRWHQEPGAIVLAINDQAIYGEASNLVVVYEGLHTYGGMSGRDMEAMARGIAESVQDDHMRARVDQVEYLGQKLIDWGVPVVAPLAATRCISTPGPSTPT